MTSDILLLSSFHLHQGRCVLGSPWKHRGETSGRCIRFVSEPQRNEKGVETCVKDMRNRQKTRSDEEYTRWKSRHFSEEWNREEKKKKGSFFFTPQLTLEEERESRGPGYSEAD